MKTWKSALFKQIKRSTIKLQWGHVDEDVEE